MTIKQCNSCKNLIYVKELGERCFTLGCTRFFMKNINCECYEYGEVNQAHKDFFESIGKDYPFTEVK